MGVKRLSLFGSLARGEARPDSDVDLAAELDPDKRIGLFEFGGMAHRLEELVGARVDLLTEPIQRERLRRRVDQDRVLVF